jgi:hypothetical protein
MTQTSLSLVVLGCLALFLSIADAAEAAKRPYRYFPLNDAIPEGFDLFDLESISDNRRVYGTLLSCHPSIRCSERVAVHHRGKTTILHDGFARTANNRGRVGGGVPLDDVTSQAALFVRDRIKLLPPLNDEEISSEVRLVTNSRWALVYSFDRDFNITYYLTRRGKVIPFVFTEGFRLFDMNDRGELAGTSFSDEGDRAFRYVPRSDEFTLLEPLATERAARGRAINRHGDVLGFSLNPGGRQRIGVWRGTRFETWFVQGTREFPTLSDDLKWNERGWIVLTDSGPDDINSYLVPRPGVRLRLADLTEGPLPAYTEILDINYRGDMIGIGGKRWRHTTEIFLLLRVGPLEQGDGETTGLATTSPALTAQSAGRRAGAYGRRD